jgi:ABC-type uncharacterized transport system auxiliary subunit
MKILLVLATAASLAGCVSIGTPAPALTLLRLTDVPVLAAPITPMTPITAQPRTLVLATQPSDAVGSGYAMAYSYSPGARAFYQYAQWLEPPDERLVQLLAERLVQRGSFSAVTALGGSVNGTLLLNLTVRELVHDFSNPADCPQGCGRLELLAELVQRRTRTLVARQQFGATVAAPAASANGAAQALSAASAEVLNQLVPWLEAAALNATY